MPLFEEILGVLLLAWPLLQLAGWHRSRLVAAAFVMAALLTLGGLLAGDDMRRPLLPLLAVLAWWEVQAVNVMVGDIPAPGAAMAARARRFLLQSVLVAALLFWSAIVVPASRSAPSSGRFPVGVVDLCWTDSTRTLPGAGPRAIPVRVWYPGEREPGLQPEGRHRASAALEADLAPRLGVGRRPWVVRGLTRTAPAAFRQMRLSTSQRGYPVVVLSHGHGGSPALLAGLAAELASTGLVVVAPEHPGGGLGVVLPDGRHLSPPAPADPGAAARDWRDTWVGDGRVVLAGIGGLVRADPDGRFTGRLVLDRVAWVGQGLGSEAGAVLARSGQVHVLVGLDPPTQAEEVRIGVPQMQIIRATADLGSGASASEVPTVAVPGAREADFTDLVRWSPFLLRRAGVGGAVDAAGMEALVRRWTVAFLSVQLLGRDPGELSRLAGQFPWARVSGF